MTAEPFARQLVALESRGRLRRLIPRSGRDFASNDYLGLSGDPIIAGAVADAIGRGVPVGSGGSRLLRGNAPEHEGLEAKAADFFRTQATLFVANGYVANLALFATLPRLPYDVQPVPPQIEDNYTTGRYFSGSMRNGIAGGYMVNTSRLDQRPLYELPALTLHEAVPGHHLQIALQQEAADQPYFRRDANVTAFTEGWGLYAEFLGEEMGFYRTPYERFGRLSYEMWRACRLVADTGMHWMGWSVEQARTCFTDNSALAPHNIETELQRYVGWPGQATAYKIGEIRLRQIRTRAEAALGEDFDVRAFHDALLVPGPLPLALLDAHMDRWIEEQRARD